MRISFAAASLAAMLATGPAAAHHGWSSYDSGHARVLTGIVTQVSYHYPHGTIQLEVNDKSWLVVLAPPSRMSSRGLPREDLRIGIEATVEGHPSRTDPGELRAERIIINGKTTELR